MQLFDSTVSRLLISPFDEIVDGCLWSDSDDLISSELCFLIVDAVRISFVSDASLLSDGDSLETDLLCSTSEFS